jgi:hypothetical protein
MLLKVQNCPNCVSLKEAWIQCGYIYIQMELCRHGSLAEYLEVYCVKAPLPEEQIWSILSDIVQV